jgi:hypothetical protein
VRPQDMRLVEHLAQAEQMQLLDDVWTADLFTCARSYASSAGTISVRIGRLGRNRSRSPTIAPDPALCARLSGEPGWRCVDYVNARPP